MGTNDLHLRHHTIVSYDIGESIELARRTGIFADELDKKVDAYIRRLTDAIADPNTITTSRSLASVSSPIPAGQALIYSATVSYLHNRNID